MKEQLYGKSLDEAVSIVVSIINNYLPWSARVVDQPSIYQIKEEIDAGRPVIVPFSAKKLRNPYFSSIFPYHMAVISGYNDEKQIFITEEPGTQFGKRFAYSYDIVMEAMHDFVFGEIANGPRRAIFTSSELNETAYLDPDRDGLTKNEEIEHGTIPYYYDSDGDGFSDGLEVKFGYLPTKNEQAIIKEGALIIAPGSPKVYLISGHKKLHILNEDVFYSHGWSWNMIEWISDAMMYVILEGKPVNMMTE